MTKEPWIQTNTTHTHAHTSSHMNNLTTLFLVRHHTVRFAFFVLNIKSLLLTLQ